jgi:type II secretory pathway component GspD/PulD (secretin)
VVGGIVTSDLTDAETSVPILGDIPVFGFLFRRTHQVELRRTLYVFITPYILYDDAFGDLQHETQKRIDDIMFAKDGIYKGLTDNLKPEPPPPPEPRSTFRFPERSKK